MFQKEFSSKTRSEYAETEDGFGVGDPKVRTKSKEPLRKSLPWTTEEILALNYKGNLPERLVNDEGSNRRRHTRKIEPTERVGEKTVEELILQGRTRQRRRYDMREGYPLEQVKTLKWIELIRLLKVYKQRSELAKRLEIGVLRSRDLRQ